MRLVGGVIGGVIFGFNDFKSRMRHLFTVPKLATPALALWINDANA
jgi:hypothetical protein